MKLLELNPKLGRGGVISFDCPLCKTHRCRINRVWKTKGNFENLSVLPATIIAKCKHMFTIQNGQIQDLEKKKYDERFIAEE
jgi:hypothetical protein